MKFGRRLWLYLAMHDLLPSRLRVRMLPRAGIQAHASAIVAPGSRLLGEAGVTVGPYSFVNSGCVLDASASIVLGARVSIGNNVMLLTSHHRMDDPAQRGGSRDLLPIRVGDGAWIAAGSIILGGVVIGPGAVIAAGSVVNRNCSPHTLYAGVPARKIRAL